MSALKKQEGGSHYKSLKIQPVEYIHANGIPFIEGCIIKYATRWKEKGGVNDLKKIIHFAELLIELEYGESLTAVEIPWYPDDSGKWVEHDGSDEPPIENKTRVECLINKERERKDYGKDIYPASEFDWSVVVAYKVIK